MATDERTTTQRTLDALKAEWQREAAQDTIARLTSDEAVERVARELYRTDLSQYEIDWGSNADGYRRMARDLIRAALAAEPTTDLEED